MDAARFSVPTVNWIRWPGDEDGVAAATPAWPLDALLDGVAGAGFRGVGLDQYTVASYVESGGRVEDLGEMLRARGLVCTDVGVLPVGTPGVLAAAESLARLASITGARACIAAHYVPTSTDEAVRQLRACADVIGDATLALEFVAYGDLRTMAEAVELCEAVGWERCRLVVDTWHFFRGDEPWPLLRSLEGDQIGLLHVNDGPRERGSDATFEGRCRRLPVGTGSFPLEDFAAAVEATGYTGVVSTEVLSTELRHRPPAEGARELMRSLRESWP